MNMNEQNEAENFLKKASKCKPEELKTLLKQVEIAIEKSEEKNRDLLMAKTIITAKLTARRN